MNMTLNSLNRTVLVIGGYGNAGLAISKLLLKHTDLYLVIAGRNLEKAQETAAKWNGELSQEEPRCSAQAVDASNTKSLDQAFANVDFVLVASSTSKYSEMVVEAATHARIKLFDILSTHTMESLRSMEAEIKAAGSCITTGCGVHPGVPGVLARCAAGRIAHPTSVRVGMLLLQNWNDLQAEIGKEAISEVDASFAVHKDMRSHTGGTMLVGKGAVYSTSTR
jgi:saccharopine dehydrogenase-like NADP-dependent oxidoreductase